MRCHAIVSIPQPRKAVWEALTDAKSWKTWYGRDLCGVDPGWEESARMVWADGEPSTITGLIPAEELEFANCRFSLVDHAERVTTLTYSEEMDPDLTIPYDPEKQARVNAVAFQFKEYVDNRAGIRSFTGLLRKLSGRT